MPLLNSLAAFALRLILGPGAENVANATRDLFRDHSETLPRALYKAHDLAWQAVGVALAGEGLFDRVRRVFASRDAKDFREQVAAFLQANAASFDGTPVEYR